MRVSELAEKWGCKETQIRRIIRSLGFKKADSSLYWDLDDNQVKLVEEVLSKRGFRTKSQKEDLLSEIKKILESPLSPEDDIQPGESLHAYLRRILRGEEGK